jgi:limonene-1,2-epoxide hydrolase
MAGKMIDNISQANAQIQLKCLHSSCMLRECLHQKKSSMANSQIPKVVAFYQNFSLESIDTMNQIYADGVLFEDPMRACESLVAVQAHMRGLITNLKSCEFVIQTWTQDDKQLFVQWTMIYSHRKLNKGLKIEVEGCSRFEFKDDLIIYHRDFFDMGKMVYEHVPLLRGLIKVLKAKLNRA